MSTPVLATKLYIPLPRPHMVARPHLIERLNEGMRLGHKLTLISAPAGFGKTTLLSDWLAGGERPVAWLSLDAADNEPARFLTYLVAALQTTAPNVGVEAQALLQSPQPPPLEALLVTLLNELTANAPERLILVLDDYHVIDAQPVADVLGYLVEHLPPQLRLVIATREDPHLPLPRLRVRNQLTELRAADLRFTAAEATAFLTQVMGLSLSETDVIRLSDRTEGWIAGLQLAALSMQGRQDIPGFIRAFAGDHRYIVDYLLEEVLQRQPEPLRRFLLQTAILDRLTGSLCDAVTDQEGGAARLEALERGAFFVVPLDDNRQWYRYHHLFAEALRAQLMAQQPDHVPTLHRQASEWYEQHGLPADAIRHALAAVDFERAADLIELAASTMRQTRQETTLLGWLRALPDELIQRRPMLSVAYAWALLAAGEVETAQARLLDAERWLETTSDASASVLTPFTEMNAVDQELRRLPASIALYRAAHALARGDVAETVRYGRRALNLLPEDDHLGRGAAEALMGLAIWASGDLKAAERTYADSVMRMQRAGYLSDALGCSIALADIQIAQGHLRQAMNTYQQALRLAEEQGEPVLRGTADIYVGMSALYRERGDLNAAEQSLQKSKELGERAGLPQNRYRWRVAMARLRVAQGDLDGALDLLDEAERLYVGDFFPNVRPIATWRARVWIAQGRVSEALDWAREQSLSPEDHLSYLREFEHITLARALLAHYEEAHAERSIDEVVGLLERLLQAAEAGERAGSVLDILASLALAHQAQGDIPAALAPLERALKLAEPEGYVRIFLDEGPVMARLLYEAVTRGIMPEYAGRLLEASGAGWRQDVSATPPHASTTEPLIEPLTQRELAVLRLFKTELSGPEIADQLVVALSTVRTHTKSIYGKLNVTNRRAAVRRAEELDLI